MSYICIRIYSFECDNPECDEVIESSTGQLLPEALAEIQRVWHWGVRKGKQFCPKHKPGGGKS